MRITLVIIVLLGIALWFYKSRTTTNTTTNKKKKLIAPEKLPTKINPTKLDGKYRSAEIMPSLICCKTVESLKGKIFLLNDAPQIPLSACDMPDECKCKYVRFNDRRKDERRGDKISEIAINSNDESMDKAEKRGRRGRRESD